MIKNIRKIIKALKITKNKHSFDLISYVVLPDHIHVLIKPKDVKNYPNIISSFKANFSRMIDITELENIRNKLTKSKISKREKGVWQRRYWEHTISDEEYLNKHLDYIHYNPVKHCYIDNVKDWKFSSFYKFVKDGIYDANWGSVCDIKHIQELVYE